ncbi:MAG TPA: hypothetical protein VJA18_04415 [Candidatus Nanoarchaeia archaeon]|nr:hypothetical protein [Candidatus Nanoarchaeia archaeon]
MTLTEYFVYIAGSFQKMNLKDLVRSSRDQPQQQVWSARLSTGVFGLPDCKAGNRGPKETNEVLLSLGNEEINKFVDLGFISCPVCRPEETPNFWEIISDRVGRKYGLSSLESYVDKKMLPFDARRLNWEELLPIVGRTPNRIYLPRDLSEQDLVQFQERFTRIRFAFPKVGYYNPAVAERFTEYRT